MRKKFYNYLLLCFGVAILLTVPSESASAREKINFNREWKFKLGDFPPAKEAGFDDSGWPLIHLPHNFSIPYFLWKEFYVGYGWYRKSFNYDSSWSGKQVYIEFEGAFIEKEIYLNGEFVGKHVGGYTGFHFDITPFLRNGENLLAVRVNNLWKPNVAPRAGEHNFIGGINRDVHIVVVDPLHVDYYGTFVSTPIAKKDEAQVNIKTDIVNKSSEPAECTLVSDIYDPQGNLVETLSSTHTIGAGKLFQFNQTSAKFSNPKLWEPATPNRYKVLTSVKKGDAVTDTYSTRFGVRDLVWRTDSGFYVNGRRMFLQGANVHQDRAGWACATTNAGFIRDVRMMKDAGFNVIRGCHYPHDPAFVEACDSIGLFYMSEVNVWGMGGFATNFTGERETWGMTQPGAYPLIKADQDAFDLSAVQQLKEMIRIHRNSPSINSWSMCNEAFYTDNASIPGLQNLLATMRDSSRLWDPTRKVAIGGAHNASVEKIGDIALYNGAGVGFNNTKNPGLPNMISEFSSVGGQNRPGNYEAMWADYLLPGRGRYDYAINSWIAGEIYWCAFDHGSIGGESMAKMGMIDYFRIPKRPYYWWRNELAKVAPPTWSVSGSASKIKLEASATTIKTDNGTDDVMISVTLLNSSGKEVNANPDVTLSIVSGPGEFPTGRSITFKAPSDNELSDIRIQDGKCAIDFRSYYAGTTVIKAKAAGCPEETITITTLGDHPFVEGVTPIVPDRPYTRYKESNVIKPSGDLNLGTYRPCIASSEASGTTARDVNDGSLQTVWKPESTDKAAWWRLDMEASYDVNRILINFPEEKNYRYTIDVSQDMTAWTTVIDQKANNSTAASRMHVGKLGEQVRFVRVSFFGSVPGALTEVSVGGAPDIVFPPNLLSGVVIGSVDTYENNPAVRQEMVFDGDASTFFDGATAQSWVGLDLGSGPIYKITGIKYIPRAGFERRLKGGKFELFRRLDMNLTTPTLLYTFPTASNPPTAGGTLTVEHNDFFRYIKYTGEPTDGFGNIAELEFYGIPETALNVDETSVKPSKAMVKNHAIAVYVYRPISQPITISLIGIDGKVIRRVKTTEPITEFPIEELGRGSYLIRIADASGNETLRVIF